MTSARTQRHKKPNFDEWTLRTCEEKSRRSLARRKAAAKARAAKYHHSAYWYAKHYGWTYSEATSYTARYLDIHEYFGFNPVLFAVAIAMDIGLAVKSDVEKIANPVKRAKLRADLMRDLRTLRRPFYYANETRRRRELAAERRKLHRRSTTAGKPTPEALLDAWTHRKDSKEAMILLGGMIHDLECYVDNCLRFDEYGNVVGRNGGIRGWLKACLPELAPKYKTLMRYKAMAVKLRQATATEDPEPTGKLLDASPLPAVLSEILRDPRSTFASIVAILDFHLDPETVLAERPQELRPCASGASPPRDCRS